MKITFRGENRELLTHNHATSLAWKTSTIASGLLRGLKLGGNFKTTLEFEVTELEQWLAMYVQKNPQAALALASKIQVEAICLLTVKDKN